MITPVWETEKMRVILSALAITTLSACAPNTNSSSGRDEANVSIDAYSCGWQHPCPSQNPDPNVLGRQNYFKSPDGSFETWHEGNKTYIRDHGQLSVTDPSRDSPECLLMLIDPKLSDPERSYENCWYRHNPDINPATNKLWRSAPPAMPLLGSISLDSAAHDLDKADQDRRMDDTKRGMQRQLDELKAERDWEHMRYLDSESDR
jgi:hypothetical protein